MPKCCVRGCGSNYSKKAPLISLHKLPRNDKLKSKWLESLGQENIDSSQENVCSLHFEESCINRSLDIVRLHDNAIPTRLPKFKFPSELPTPGCVWWFDAHCYYKEEFQSPCGLPPQVPGAPPSTSPCPCPPPKNERPVVRVDPCADKTPPCKPDPCKVEKVIPLRSPEVCEPCKDDEPKKKC